MEALISAHNLSKQFDGVMSLNKVSISGMPGSIHAVTGENGAGKSTLMKLMAGVLTPTSGEITLRGKVVHFSSPLAALNAGISTVFQEFSLVPNLTVSENLFLGRELRSHGMLDRTLMRQKALHALGLVGLDIDPDRIIASLTVAEQQSVEIAKGLTVDADIFIFDEPTAALNSHEVTRLEKLLLSLRDQGKCIFYISHRMREIFTLCDTATVLKDGRLVGSYPLDELNQDRLLALMVGRELSQLYPPRRPPSQAPVALDVKSLRLTASDRPLNFQIRQGEIVALAGLEGQGQRDIARALAGVARHSQGTIEVTGPDHHRVPFHPAQGSGHALYCGIAFMPEDRKAEGLYLDLSVADNLRLGMHQQRMPWQTAKRYHNDLSQWVSSLSIRTSSTSQTVVHLSGGNRQKVMLGRWLAVKAQVLIIEEPTRGVDVGAKIEIYQALRQFCDAGGAVLFTSRELPEVLGFAERILVVNNRQIVQERRPEHTSEEEILQATRYQEAAS